MQSPACFNFRSFDKNEFGINVSHQNHMRRIARVEPGFRQAPWRARARAFVCLQGGDVKYEAISNQSENCHGHQRSQLACLH